MRSWRLWSVLSLLFVSATVAGAQAPAASIDFEPYGFLNFDGHTEAAELGFLEVPESRANARAKPIRLAVVRFKSTSSNPGPPIVYLAGGPGGSGIDTARTNRYPVFMALRAIADVITFDQRGVGMSAPSTNCRERINLPPSVPLEERTVLFSFVQQAQLCAQRLARRGIDLGAYNTVESADDIDALRQALGADKISLWGTSYGTHLALATIRRHGEHIHRAVLHGVEGPDHTLKLPKNVDRNLRKVAKAISADPNVGPAMPNLVGRLRALVAKLEQEPLTATVAVQGGTVDVVVGRLYLMAAMASIMGSRAAMAAIPTFIDQLERGIVPPLLARDALSIRVAGIGPAMASTMDCASGVSPRRWKKILRQEGRFVLGRIFDYPFPEFCQAWNVPDLGKAFRSRVNSDVPTLFVSGSLDGQTPASNAVEVAKGFPNAAHLTIVNGSHDSLFVSDLAIQTALLDFLAGREIATPEIVLPRIPFVPFE